MIDPQLNDKVVLITGANHGIGAATARAFAAVGAKVFISYFREPTIYSDEELAVAESEAVGGDKLYRAFQRQTADWLGRGDPLCRWTGSGHGGRSGRHCQRAGAL